MFLWFLLYIFSDYEPELLEHDARLADILHYIPHITNDSTGTDMHDLEHVSLLRANVGAEELLDKVELEGLLSNTLIKAAGCHSFLELDIIRRIVLKRLSASVGEEMLDLCRTNFSDHMPPNTRKTFASMWKTISKKTKKYCQRSSLESEKMLHRMIQAATYVRKEITFNHPLCNFTIEIEHIDWTFVMQQFAFEALRSDKGIFPGAVRPNPNSIHYTVGDLHTGTQWFDDQKLFSNSV